jgi:hypothetical protein
MKVEEQSDMIAWNWKPYNALIIIKLYAMPIITVKTEWVKRCPELIQKQKRTWFLGILIKREEFELEFNKFDDSCVEGDEVPTDELLKYRLSPFYENE